MSPHNTNIIDLDQAPTLVSRNDFDYPEPTANHPSSNCRVNGTNSSYHLDAGANSVHDLVCVGFGPASLAVAVALHDALEAETLATPPKILFLEKQRQFAWHAGMLLQGAKMQISFIKDLASLRDPRSKFTFLNYLHENGRLVDFTNLGTFLPARAEYEDYLRWCASHFDDVVRYSNEVLSVSPVLDEGLPLRTFNVTSKHVKTGVISNYRARNILMAIGGQPSLPKVLPGGNPFVIHSSEYAHLVPQILKDQTAPYRVAVMGAGQSAVEIFNNIQTLYPRSKTWLIMRTEFLKPSDDSPFVNTIFNPAFVDTLHRKSSAYRKTFIADARTTNYGVVRLGLIERTYEKMYDQMRELGRDERRWPHRIMAGRRVLGVDENAYPLRIKLCLSLPGEEEAEDDGPALEQESIDVDLVIAATGYRRDAHVGMLEGVWPYLPVVSSDQRQEFRDLGDRWLVETPAGSKSEGKTPCMRAMEVGRDYGVRFSPGMVAPGSGIWLQGCCEASHGLSDTLLSILGTRSGEIVESIFLREATDSD